MNYLDLIQRRKSIRDFKEKAVSKEQLKELTAYHEKCRRLIPDIPTELGFLDSECKSILEGKAGYFGKIFGAPYYALLLSAPHEYALENAGYMCEDILLKLTDMGLDSCWLTINDEESIRKELGLDTDRQVVSVIAFGYGRKERNSYQLDIKSQSDIDVKFQKGHIAPKSAVHEILYYKTWGHQVTLDDSNSDPGLIDACYAASLAPMYLNSQTFRLILDIGNMVLIGIRNEETTIDNEKLSWGAVMLNFSAVLETHRPFPVVWEIGGAQKKYDLPDGCEILGHCHI